MNIYDYVNDDDFINAYNTSISKADVARKLGLPENGKSYKFFDLLIRKLNIDKNILKTNFYKKHHITKICPVCQKQFDVRNNEKDTVCCSCKCSNTYFSKERHSDESNIKRSEKLKAKVYQKPCKICGNMVETKSSSGNCFCDKCWENHRLNKLATTTKPSKKRRLQIELHKTQCSDCGNEIWVKTNDKAYCYSCREKNPSYYPHQLYDENGKKLVNSNTRKLLSKNVQERIKNGTHKGWKTRNITSYPEQFFKKVLENNNIGYEFNKPVYKRDLGVNDSSSYFLDFALLGNIDLEIDGKQHKYKDRKESDAKRDELLTSHGWKVYRIEWKNLPKYNDYMKNEIDKFLEFYNNVIKSNT